MDYYRQDGQSRVVVTGMGVITPLGIGISTFWEALKCGKSGIGRITQFDPHELAVQIAGEVSDFDASDYLDPKELRRTQRSSQFVVAATQMAIDDAGLSQAELEAESERTGAVMGTTYAGIHALAEGVLDVRIHHQRPNPFSVVQSLTNMPTFFAARTAHASGVSNAITTACAAGTQAIGEGCALIRQGRADRMIVGGVDALITDYAIAGFDSLTSLARNYNHDPASASRPFDADRSGFVYSEGCTALILETLEVAIKRDARIYAEVRGHAATNDAYHITSLHPEGKGALLAMKWAMEDAKLNGHSIDYINAHGTSTKSNDKVETYAIKRLLNENAYDIPISSTKSMIGHALGGAGAIEAAACMMTLQDQIIHPTINYTTPDPDCDLDYVPNEARSASVKNVLSNSFGLGGQNACVVFGKI